VQSPSFACKNKYYSSASFPLPTFPYASGVPVLEYVCGDTAFAVT